MKNGKEVILLVIGETDAGKALQELLSNRRYELVVVSNSKEALDYLKVDPYDIDLIVTELELPMLNGIDLADLLQLSDRMKTVPIMIAMDMDKEKERAEALERGAEDIILQPFVGKEVLNRIQNTLVSKGHPQYLNIMEEALEKELDKCIKSLGVCRCRQCRKDIMTLALNRLKPRYVSSEKGRLLSIVEQMSYDYVPEMLRALTESAEIVKKNPRHQV